MIPGEVYSLVPSDLFKAKELLEPLEFILQVQTYGKQLRLITSGANGEAAQASELLSANNITVEDMRKVLPRMEEAYISLMKQFAEDELQ
jgi:hypothetical protein